MRNVRKLKITPITSNILKKSHLTYKQLAF